MPMFRSWVPKRIQPWIYIAQVICIQFSCGVYLGAMEAVRGTTALQLEELLMLLYAGLAGMAVWFPMLFRMKFRFTNQQLLITSAVVIAVCNLITMRTTNMAILLPGVYVGVLITLYWLGHKRWKVWKLFAIGFGCILVYSMWMYFYLDFNVPIEQYRLGLAFRGCAYAILAVSLMWSLHESVHDLQHFFMALFIFNVIHMYLAGASGYGLYTTLFKHFMADNMARYGEYITLSTIDSQLLSTLNSQLSTLTQSVMSVTLKQIFGQIIWVSGFMTFAFLLLDIPRVRTGIEKVPYWPVYGIKLLSRLR